MTNKNKKTDELPTTQINLALIEQYVKKLTLNTFYSKYALSQLKGKTAIEFAVAPGMRKLADDVYEVTLNIDIASKLDGGEKGNGSGADNKEVFRAQLEYAGVFKLTGEASEEIKEEICLVTCATLLFPFARREVADAITGSGYAPVLLDPINFKQFFMQHKERQGAKVH